jgi:hypothetical protein
MRVDLRDIGEALLPLSTLPDMALRRWASLDAGFGTDIPNLPDIPWLATFRSTRHTMTCAGVTLVPST